MRWMALLAGLLICSLCGCEDSGIRLAPQQGMHDPLPSDVPAPPGMHMISNQTSGRWYTLAVLQIPQAATSSEVMGFMKDELPKHGWAVKPPPGPPPMPKAEGISFSKAGYAGNAVAYPEKSISGCKLVIEIKPVKK